MYSLVLTILNVSFISLLIIAIGLTVGYIFSDSELDGKYSLISCMMLACAHAWSRVAVFWLHLAQCGMLMALGMPCMWAILIGQKVVTSS